MADSPIPQIPIALPLDAEARAVIDASYRIGTESQSDEHHSYSSLLVACLLANNVCSRWFRRRLSEMKVEPAAQKQKLGLTEERLMQLAQDGHSFTARPKALEWTMSTKEWLKRAENFATRRDTSKAARVSSCDLIAAFVFARSFHSSDRQKMGLGVAQHGSVDRGLELANGFLSFVLTRFSNDYKSWSEIFEKELGEKPQPDVMSGPATLLASDKWTTDDRLGYRGYARAIHHFIVHPRTEPPLSISIQAPWGAGKTSLMRMIQKELDPDATEAATLGGSKATHDTKTTGSCVTAKDFLDILRGKGKAPHFFDEKPPERYSVWFNAWKYESGTQLWAGLATAIIEQLAERMTPKGREWFFLRLQASRVDPSRVRRQIYELAYIRTLTALNNIWIWILGLAPVVAGMVLHAMGKADTSGPVAGAVGSVIVVAGQVAITYGKQEEKVEAEPVTATLGDIISVPNYDLELGFTHHVVEDLRRVFDTLQAQAGKDKSQPIIVFVDDLDRCSPTKVASVMEGINMFLAGDFMPCMFIIGMDPQLVSAALEEAHKDIMGRLPRYDSKTPLGWRFMDKFIQLPFTIPPPGDDRVKEFTDHLLQDAEVASIVAEGEKAARQYDPASGVDPIEAARSTAADVATRHQIAAPKAEAAAKLLRASFALRLQDQMSDKFSDTQPIVQEMLEESIGSFSTNPRDIKRLLNIVRFNYLISRARVADDQAIPSPETLGRWIGLSLRWPQFVRWLQWSPAGSGAAGQRLASKQVVHDRLATLESASKSADTFEAWQTQIRKDFKLAVGDVSWDNDPALRDYLREEAKPLSSGAGLGFY
jgi:hypothetical protein